MYQAIRTYQVKEGDTLFSIAKEYTGDEMRWGELCGLNTELQKSLNHIHVGMRLTLPISWMKMDQGIDYSHLDSQLRQVVQAVNSGRPRCVSFDDQNGRPVLTVDLLMLQQVTLTEPTATITMTNILGNVSHFTSYNSNESRLIHKELIAAFKAYRN